MEQEHSQYFGHVYGRQSPAQAKNKVVYGFDLGLGPGGDAMIPTTAAVGAANDFSFLNNTPTYPAVPVVNDKHELSSYFTGSDAANDSLGHGTCQSSGTDSTSPPVFVGDLKTKTKPSSPSNENPVEVYIKEKKKAQNRAAQKAFRERKEAKLKELEQKLQESEKNRDALLKELDELRKQNLVINNENKLLLQRNREQLPVGGVTESVQKFTFPAKEHIKHPSEDAAGSTPNNPISMQYMAGGKKLLTVPAAWEYLHAISREKEIDIYMIMKRLKGTEVCHGNGPAYTREAIDRLVEECLQNNGTC